MVLFLLVPEIPIEFIVPLKDVSVLEKQNVKLEVKVNKSNVELTWLKDGTELTPSERIDIDVDGQVHAINIKSAMLNDAGEYVVKVGLVATKGQLTVDEEPTVFTKPLEDQTVTEFQEATFTCEVSKPNRVVTFYKDGQEIKPNKKYQIVTENCTHTLKINDAQVDETGKIEARVQEASCEATFTVEGK